jgi:CBS domain containing-hemolysin-like protein
VDLNRHFGSELPENEDFSTVSGFILDKLGRFPELGDTVTFGDLDLIVEEKTDRMVKTVKVRQILSAAHPGA